MEWEIELIDARQFYIAVDFSEPTLVSQYSKLDGITVEIKNQDVFMGNNGERAEIPQLIKEFKIPTIERPNYENEETTTNIASAFEQGVKSFMGANTIISLFIASAM